jgi:Putative peptidoglycan binding domain
MKTKIYWVALLAGAVWVTQTQADSHHGGGSTSASAPAQAAGPGRSGPVSSSMPVRNFGGSRMIPQRFSTAGRHGPPSVALSQPSIRSGQAPSIRMRQAPPRALGRNGHLARSPNGAITNRRSGGTQVRNGNSLPANWRNHVAGRRSAEWHRDWDRNRDHFWHGHHCRFIDGSWVIFNLGFYPFFNYGYPYGYYPYAYYPYDYYPYSYSYDPGYYGAGVYQGPGYYDQNANGYLTSGSTAAAAQQQLAREGYYRGKIDGILGPETRRAIMRYQSDQGLRVTGRLSIDLLQALGLQEVASN